ncbi:MAG: hypothetical protein PHI52_08805 [Bacteroidales bacterium]|nr:hypothetical protein [Bacteroidales bacterium]
MSISNIICYDINDKQIPLDESYINKLKNEHIAYFIIDKKNKKDKRIKEIKKELNNINNELSSYIYNKNIIVNWLLKNNIISNESIAGYIASAVTNDDLSGSGNASETD